MFTIDIDKIKKQAPKIFIGLLALALLLSIVRNQYLTKTYDYIFGKTSFYKSITSTMSRINDLYARHEKKNEITANVFAIEKVDAVMKAREERRLDFHKHFVKYEKELNEIKKEIDAINAKSDRPLPYIYYPKYQDVIYNISDNTIDIIVAGGRRVFKPVIDQEIEKKRLGTAKLNLWSRFIHYPDTIKARIKNKEALKEDLGSLLMRGWMSQEDKSKLISVKNYFAGSKYYYFELDKGIFNESLNYREAIWFLSKYRDLIIYAIDEAWKIENNKAIFNSYNMKKHKYVDDGDIYTRGHPTRAGHFFKGGNCYFVAQLLRNYKDYGYPRYEELDNETFAYGHETEILW